MNTNEGDCAAVDEDEEDEDEGEEEEEEEEEEDDNGSTTTCEASGRPLSHKSRISNRYLSK